MKKINLILGALVCLFAFSACTEEVEYTPATLESANGVYFPSTSQPSIDLKADANTYDVEICRTETSAEEIVKLIVETDDTVGALQIPDSVVFAAGASKANLTINYDFEKMGYGKEFKVKFAIDPAVASTVGVANYEVIFVVPEPWKSLGMATFADTYFFLDTYKVEIQQNELDPTYFRLVYPYHEAFEVDDDGYFGGPWENTDEYLYFQLLQPGSSLAGVPITMNDLIYFEPFMTGFEHPTYEVAMELIHPAHISSLAAESNFTYNKVLSYQENGLPAVVQIAPMYYMDGVGGFNYTQNDGIVTIVFPGVVVKDYSVGIEYAGRFTNASDETFADFNVAMGEDVASVKVGLAQSEDVNGVLAGILDGSIESVEMTEAGTTRFAIKDPGVYTAVAISYNADGEAQEAVYTQFEYSAAGGPVWNSLGLAQYTDDFVASLFTDVQPVTYNVEIQESEDKPGLYRLVNPYGAAYPYNQEGDWNTSSDFYLEINAQDPQGVYIETQALGFDWGYGEFLASSQTAQLLANYDLETIKAAGGYCGTLSEGVITFPTKALLVSAATLDGWYYANSNGAFKVVLPSASKSSKSVKAITNRVKADKKNIGGQRLKKMDRQLPKKFQMK